VEGVCGLNWLSKPFPTTIKDDAMSDYSEPNERDSAVDAWAIFTLILLAVATAVFWVSQQ
jgi:hypothetical protein